MTDLYVYRIDYGGTSSVGLYAGKRYVVAPNMEAALAVMRRKLENAVDPTIDTVTRLGQGPALIWEEGS